MKKFKIILLLGVFAMAVSCCNNSSESKQNLNYANSNNWVSLPSAIDKKVDVFYVYPTIYVGKDPQNMDISDSSLRAKAQRLLVSQAGVYSMHANLFAPFYRQQSAALQSMDAGNGGNDAFKDSVFQIGAKDIERAFDYYLEQFNPDRPFILAGHSQGTMALINLMRKRFEDTVLQKRLVAAYLIGYSITKVDLEKYPWMKLAETYNDNGVIITFNTQGADAGSSPVLLPGAVCINPINWKTDSTHAHRNSNLGAKFFDETTGELLKEIPDFAAAHIDIQKGALIVTDMNISESEKSELLNMGRWPKRVYHKYDYAFWYNNLQQNVSDRIDSYFSEE